MPSSPMFIVRAPRPVPRDAFEMVWFTICLPRGALACLSPACLKMPPPAFIFPDAATAAPPFHLLLQTARFPPFRMRGASAHAHHAAVPPLPVDHLRPAPTPMLREARWFGVGADSAPYRAPARHGMSRCSVPRRGSALSGLPLDSRARQALFAATLYRCAEAARGASAAPECSWRALLRQRKELHGQRESRARPPSPTPVCAIAVRLQDAAVEPCAMSRCAFFRRFAATPPRARYGRRRRLLHHILLRVLYYAHAQVCADTSYGRHAECYRHAA